MEDLARPHRRVHPSAGPPPLVIDCGRCAVRPQACGDCVVTALLGAEPPEGGLEAPEVAALAVLADSGMVPPLRLVLGDEAQADV